MDREQRIISRGLQCRSEGTSKVIEGYAAVFFNPADIDNTQYRLWGDTYERIMPGAFDEALKRPDDVRCLFNHNADYLLGRNTAQTLTLTVDSVGLRFRCQLPNEEQGRSVSEKISRGDVSGCSFSFLADTVTWREESGLTFREIRSTQLFDVGPVTFPAYRGTDVSVAKRSFETRQPAKPKFRGLAELELDFQLRKLLGERPQ